MLLGFLPMFKHVDGKEFGFVVPAAAAGISYFAVRKSTVHVGRRNRREPPRGRFRSIFFCRAGCAESEKASARGCCWLQLGR